MVNLKRNLLTLLLMLSATVSLWAWQNMPMSELHIEGRYLCDEEGNHVNLHGFGQTYSPWFNEQNTKWSNYETSSCLKYNKGLIDNIEAHGWKMQWLRLHMDPYWSNTPGAKTTGEADISAFDEDRFSTYLSLVFVNMAKYAISHGLYVVMRPPGVCPKQIAVGDDYHKYLIKVWKKVCRHKDLRNNPYVMFELANEPIDVKGTDGQYTSWSDGSQRKCTEFFQAIVDTIRAQGCNNILWVPGMSYQMNYQGYAKYPIVEREGGRGIGYAVHCYPGWYGSDSEDENGSVEQGVVTKGNGYAEFQAGWNNNVMPVAKIAPILITEMDWAPKKYNASWGKATTGEAGGIGFGANFKYIMDKTGNVSWMLFTGPEWLAKYDDAAPDGKTFLTDPDACVRPIYRWFQEYADPEWTFQDTLSTQLFYFPGTDVPFSPSIWESGSFVNQCLVTGQYGFGGWQFGGGIDLSEWKYLVVNLKQTPASGSWSLRVFDQNSYWSDPYMNNFGNQKTRIIVPLKSMKRTVNGSVTTQVVDPKHIYIIGFWSTGGTPLYIKDVYLTNNSDFSNPTSLDNVVEQMTDDSDVWCYTLTGQRQRLDASTRGLRILGNHKVILFR